MSIRRGSLLLVALALLVGCRQDMHDAPRIDPLEAHAFFDDDRSARHPPAGTVARGWLRDDPHLYEGKDDAGAFVDALPMPLDAALLARGQQRYEIFCSVCHDSTGQGQGMIVRRGFKEPTKYTDERLMGMSLGYYFDVITNGYGVMSGYAAQVPVEDRWAIAAYIRVLQISQRSSLAALPAETQRAFHDFLANPPADDGHGGHGGGHDDTGHGAAGHSAAGHGATDHGP